MFSLGVLDVEVVPAGPAPAYTMWEKGSQKFDVRIRQDVIDTWDDESLQFLLRHEIGHVVLGHFSFDECQGPDAIVAADISINYHLRADDDIIRKFNGVVARDWLKELGLKYEPYPLTILHEMLHDKTRSSQSMCGGVQGVGDEDDMVEATTAALAARGELSEEERDSIGSNPGNSSASNAIHSLSETRPEWAEKLSEWAHNIVEMVLDRSRTHKRPSWSYKAYGLHVPTTQPTWAYKPSTVVLLVDTSGSMISLVQQIGPTVAFLNSHNIKVRLIAGDTRVLYDELLVTPPTNLPGGGGTDIVPLFKHAIKEYEPEGIVCFSDLYIPSYPPDPQVPVLWVTDMNKPNVPYGEVVQAK